MERRKKEKKKTTKQKKEEIPFYSWRVVFLSFDFFLKNWFLLPEFLEVGILPKKRKIFLICYSEIMVYFWDIVEKYLEVVSIYKNFF